jgi:hypothetical protein
MVNTHRRLATAWAATLGLALSSGLFTPAASAQRAPASDLPVIQLRDNFYVIGG